MKKNDIILLFSVLILSALLFSIFFLILDGKSSVVVVTLDGEEYARLELDEDTELLVTSEHGSNLIVIENGKVFVKDADCPDKICVKSGCADEMKTIVCLPHRLTVSVETENH